MLPDYAELHCITNFTFLRGASHPEELAARAAKLGYCALAVTDECSLAGVVRAHVAAKEHGIKLIVGAEFRLADGPKLVLLATDREAYGNLSQLITAARRRSRKGSYRLGWDDLDVGVPGCLAILIPPDEPASNLPSPSPHPMPFSQEEKGISSLPSPSPHPMPFPHAGEGNLEPPLSTRERGGGEGWRGAGVRDGEGRSEGMEGRG